MTAVFFIGITLSHLACATNLIEPAFTPTINEEEKAFYRSCYEEALSHMEPSLQERPDFFYVEQARISAEYPNAVILWGLANEEDYPRDDAIILGYAVLEKVIGKPQEELKCFFADPWLFLEDKVTGENRRMWRVNIRFASDLITDDMWPNSYNVFVDAADGTVIRIEEYEPARDS